MPDVPSPDWLSWGFWAQHHESLRDLMITIAALVGIPFVIWREWLHHRQTKAALHQAATAQLRHEAQVAADRERRITDNFTRAVEQLGSDKLETRLGAIYALERIARESRDDHWPIMETLTAFVRERAPWPPVRTTEPKDGEEKEEQLRPPNDVQAALTVIGRRRREHEGSKQRLNLSVTDLRGADLGKAHLENAALTGAHLEYALLREAHLEGASLWFAHLEVASLGDARLGGAAFYKTHLQGAELLGTDLTQEQFDYSHTDETTELPPHIKRPGKPAGGNVGSERERAMSEPPPGPTARG